MPYTQTGSIYIFPCRFVLLLHPIERLSLFLSKFVLLGQKYSPMILVNSAFVQIVHQNLSLQNLSPQNWIPFASNLLNQTIAIAHLSHWNLSLQNLLLRYLSCFINHRFKMICFSLEGFWRRQVSERYRWALSNKIFRQLLLFDHGMKQQVWSNKLYIRKFRRNRLKSHIWLTASSYMVKLLRISSYTVLGSLPHIWSLYMMKIKFSFLYISVQAFRHMTYSITSKP